MQHKEFRYHPIVEGLKVNEDGTEVLLNGKRLMIKEFYVEETKRIRRYVYLLSKNRTITRLVCECFHGLAENRGLSATLKDPEKGDHYTNIYWAKRGMKINPVRHRKVSQEDHLKIQERLASGEKIKEILKDYPFTNATYCNYKRLYGTKENE